MKYTTVCVQKKLMERHIAEAVEMFLERTKSRNCMKMCTERLQTLVIRRNKQGGDNMAVSTMNILIICVTILLFAIITKDDKNDKDDEE